MDLIEILKCRIYVAIQGPQMSRHAGDDIWLLDSHKKYIKSSPAIKTYRESFVRLYGSISSFVRCVPPWTANEIPPNILRKP